MSSSPSPTYMGGAGEKKGEANLECVSLQLGLGPVAVQQPDSDSDTDSDDGGFGRRAGCEIGAPWRLSRVAGCPFGRAIRFHFL
jgi:hypothetical protein